MSDTDELQVPLVQGEQTTEKKASFGQILFYICLFLVSGTFSIILGKLCFQTKSVGRHGIEHHFLKPWFQNAVMFSGMCIPLVWYEVGECRRRFKSGMKLMDRSWKVYWICMVPAMCDLLATGLMFIGLIWIRASVWQMCRGSIVVFAALIVPVPLGQESSALYPYCIARSSAVDVSSSGAATPFLLLFVRLTVLFQRVFWLKKGIKPYQVLGMVVVVFALGIVGFSSLQSTDVTKNVTAGQKLLGMGLVVAAQLVQSLQTVIEEKLTHDIKASSNLVVGLEGFWGLLVVAGVVFPTVQNLPGKDGGGLHEDIIDTFDMLSNSGLLIGFNIALIVVLLTFNVSSVNVTKLTHSVTRNILEPVRTLLVWVATILIHYGISKSYGENLTMWSLVQLLGFLVLVVGLFCYNGVIKLTAWFDYEDTAVEMSASPEMNKKEPDV